MEKACADCGGVFFYYEVHNTIKRCSLCGKKQD